MVGGNIGLLSKVVLTTEIIEITSNATILFIFVIPNNHLQKINFSFAKLLYLKFIPS